MDPSAFEEAFCVRPTPLAATLATTLDRCRGWLGEQGRPW